MYRLTNLYPQFLISRSSSSAYLQVVLVLAGAGTLEHRTLKPERHRDLIQNASPVILILDITLSDMRGVNCERQNIVYFR